MFFTRLKFDPLEAGKGGDEDESSSSSSSSSAVGPSLPKGPYVHEDDDDDPFMGKKVFDEVAVATHRVLEKRKRDKEEGREEWMLSMPEARAPSGYEHELVKHT